MPSFLVEATDGVALACATDASPDMRGNRDARSPLALRARLRLAWLLCAFVGVAANEPAAQTDERSPEGLCSGDVDASTTPEAARCSTIGGSLVVTGHLHPAFTDAAALDDFDDRLASLGASACFLLGASLAATRTSAALFVAAFVCVFEATSSVCAAAVGLEAGRAVLRAAPERLRLPRATSLAFVFAALSACGYAVDVSTQGVTDLLSLDVRRRFEARAAFAAFASGAFLVFLSARFARRALQEGRRIKPPTLATAAGPPPVGSVPTRWAPLRARVR